MFEPQVSHRKHPSWSCHLFCTLITNKKLTFQLLRVRWRGLPSVLWQCVRVTLLDVWPALLGYLLLFAEADAPSELAVERLWLSLGKNVRRDGVAAGKVWAWKSDRPGHGCCSVT